MIQLGPLTLERSRPAIAVVFTDGLSQRRIREAKALGMDLAELRIDLFDDTSPAHVVAEAQKFEGIASIATIRSQVEGGRWQGTERERRALFQAVIPYVAAADVELGSTEVLGSVVRSIHRAGKLAIVSFHDFASTPPYRTLVRKLRDAFEVGADIAKVATYAADDEAVARLARLLVEHARAPLVALAMGPAGIKSRIFFPALGSLFTFASLDRRTAPGQLTLAETSRQLSFYYPGRSLSQPPKAERPNSAPIRTNSSRGRRRRKPDPVA